MTKFHFQTAENGRSRGEKKARGTGTPEKTTRTGAVYVFFPEQFRPHFSSL